MLNRALKIIRIFYKLNQKDLAEQLGISRAHISEIENGKKTPSYGLLQRYSEVFDIPVSNLIFFSEHIEDIQKIEVSKFRKFLARNILDVMEFFADKTNKLA